MHTQLIGYLILGAIGAVLAYVFIRGPRQMSPEERSNELLFWLTIALMLVIIGCMISAIGLAVFLIVHGPAIGL